MTPPLEPLHPLMREVLAGASPPLERFLEVLTPHLPWLADLEATPQDPLWHGEGDVRVHTARVLEEVYRLPQLGALTPQKRLTLVLGAVLHDLGKTVTTRVRDDGRIVSPLHPQRGRSYAALKLLELGLPSAVWSGVLALIGHHHDPLRLVRDEAPLRAYTRLARLCDLELVYALEQADLRGREATDTAEQLEQLEFFRLQAEDWGLWGSAPYGGWRETICGALSGDLAEFTLEQSLLDFEAGRIHTPEEAISRGYRFRGGFSELTVTVGPSGSGKSAWVRQHAGDAVVVSLDALRLERTGTLEDQSQNGQVQQQAREQLRVALRAGRPVIWEATGTRFDLRAVPIRFGMDYGARVRLAVFAVPERELARRNLEREHPVPSSVLAKQLTGLEFPLLDEAHRTVYINGFGRTLE